MRDWNYEKGILQASATLFHYFGVENPYQDDEVIKKWLDEHQFKQVFALLIDGMGTSLLEEYLPEDSFLRRYHAETISTVYPPTTVAATSSFITGRSPKENGWLGWSQYFKEKDDEIILFYESGMYSKIDYAGFVNGHIPVAKNYDVFNAHGVKADSIWPHFGPSNPCNSIEEIMDTIVELSKDSELKFVYAYWDAFDQMLHVKGPSANEPKRYLQKINKVVEKAVKKLPKDTGLLILADHGQIDVGEVFDISLDDKFCSYLRHRPTLEARTIAFHIKEDKFKEFEDYFNKTYGEHFELLTHKEVMDKELFGPGEASPYFEEYIGDYLAISKDMSEISFGDRDVKGDHAGRTIEEEMIPIILYPEVSHE